jgi:exopolyphosphatase/guanosine-5'-triphosphate,3'-diphosphate pyrophosphatase
MNSEPKSRKAVIDIGTNTINLLVVSAASEGFLMEYFERIPARLGEGGMMSNQLTDEAMSRGLHAICEHVDTCADWKVDHEDIRITATSAVRSARNRQEFIDCVKDETGLDIEVIDGQREAELIWKGVRLTGLLEEGPALIMDIGGGSTEFILADGEQVHWMKSYDLGVTRLKERFNASDPFTTVDELGIRAVLEVELSELWEAFAAFPVQALIGASGSFNSIDLMLAVGDYESLPEVKHRISVSGYKKLSLDLRRKDRAKRAAIPGLIPDRVDTMPYSALLIDIVIEKLGIELMWRSSYALKEGLVSESIG